MQFFFGYTLCGQMGMVRNSMSRGKITSKDVGHKQDSHIKRSKHSTKYADM